MERAGVARAETKRRVNVGLRLLAPAEVSLGGAQHSVSRDEIAVQRQRSFKGSDALSSAVGEGENNAHRIMGRRVVGRDHERPRGGGTCVGVAHVHSLEIGTHAEPKPSAPTLEKPVPTRRLRDHIESVALAGHGHNETRLLRIGLDFAAQPCKPACRRCGRTARSAARQGRSTACPGSRPGPAGWRTREGAQARRA